MLRLCSVFFQHTERGCARFVELGLAVRDIAAQVGDELAVLLGAFLVLAEFAELLLHLGNAGRLLLEEVAQGAGIQRTTGHRCQHACQQKQVQVQVQEVARKSHALQTST